MAGEIRSTHELNTVVDTVVHCDVVHVRTQSTALRLRVYVFSYFPTGKPMEIHMQELLHCGWFILNDSQSQAPSFGLDNNMFDPTHNACTHMLYANMTSQRAVLE